MVVVIEGGTWPLRRLLGGVDVWNIRGSLCVMSEGEVDEGREECDVQY